MQPEGLTASNIGVVLANMGRLDEADEWLAKSTELEPNNPGWKNYRVHFEHLRGNTDESRRLNEELRQAESADPYWLFRTHIADWLLDIEEGRLSAGARSLAAAIAAGDPTEALRAHLLQAELDMALGELEAAVRGVESALQQYPLEDVPPLDRPVGFAASILAQAGDPEAARALLDRQRDELGPLADRDQLRFEYADAWIDMAEGRYAEAIPVLRNADRGYGCDPCAEHAVATAFDRAGQPDSAVAYYEKYLAPVNNWRTWIDGVWRGWTLERLGQLYDEMGDLEQAAGYYGLFVELWDDADPELQPRVQAARTRMEEIVRERG
jgi:tetratricopeptide (TPR) repeat protein